MNTSGVFTLHKYTIKHKSYEHPFYIIPFGDVHRNASGCDVERWKEFLDWAKIKENCYFLGMGDYDDFLSASERRIINNPDLHETSREQIEEWQERLTDNFAHEIRFMKGRLIGLLEGNHFSLFQDGTTTTQRLCQKMKCQYLGVNSFIRLIVEHDKNHRQKLDMWVHHGLGASRLGGSSLNTVEQMIMNARADIYLMGHNHRKSIGMDTMLGLTDSQKELKLEQRKIIYARTGSFLRAYIAGKSSYIVDKGMRPTDLGTIKIEITPRIKKHHERGRIIEEKRYLDMHVSL